MIPPPHACSHGVLASHEVYHNLATPWLSGYHPNLNIGSALSQHREIGITTGYTAVRAMAPRSGDSVSNPVWSGSDMPGSNSYLSAHCEAVPHSRDNSAEIGVTRANSKWGWLTSAVVAC